MSDLQYSLRPLDWKTEFIRLLRRIDKQLRPLEDDKRRKLASYQTSIALGGFLAIHSRQLLSIKWNDVLYKNETDSYCNTNLKGHSIAFHPHLLKIIRKNYEICRPFANHHLIVSNPLKHQKMLIDRTFNYRLARIFSTCGFDIGKEGSHILRKTGALRIYHEKGGGDQAMQYVSELLGHRSIGTTRTYLCLKNNTDMDMKTSILTSGKI